MLDMNEVTHTRVCIDMCVCIDVYVYICICLETEKGVREKEGEEGRDGKRVERERQGWEREAKKEEA